MFWSTPVLLLRRSGRHSWTTGETKPILVGMLKAGETEPFPCIFAAVERLYREGDRYVKEAMTVELLEDLQNQNIHNSTHPDQFCEFLGTESQKWWDKLYRFWDHGELLTDD